MKIISLDGGFGDTKVAVRINGGRPDYQKHINLIAKLGPSNPSTKSDGGTGIVEFQGDQYLVGYSATQVANSQLVAIDGYDSLKAVTPLTLKKHLDHYGEMDRIVVSLSVAFYEKAGDFKNYLCQVLSLDPSKVFLIPQGVGCKVALDNLGFNLDDPTFKSNLKNYLGLDIGYNTLDVILVIDGELIFQNIKGYSGLGVMKVVENLKKDLRDLGIEEDIPFTKVKTYLTQKVLTHRGTRVDLSQKVEKHIQDYLGELRKFLEANYKEQLDSIEFLTIFGGGANLIKDYRSLWDAYYPPEFVKIPVTGPEFYNALGGLFIGDK